jgi:hypothetical protein
MNEPIYSKPRRPPRLLVALALLVAGLALVLLLVLALRDALDPLARAEREAARWRAEQLDAQLAPLDLIVAAGWRLLPLVLAAGAGVVALVVAYRRWGGHQYIQAEHVTRALEALHRHPTVPQTLSYSTHYAPHLRAATSALPGHEVAESPQLAAAPSFAQLLAGGRVGRGNPLLLGICDPHAGAADDSLAATLAPLSAAFVCEPASADRAILEIVRYVADVGRRRVSGQDGDTTPLILWVDELTRLLGRSSVAGELAELLERVAQEYRKRAVFVCASGQIWTAARTSSELRDSFASVLCHRMKRSQARLLLPTHEAEQAERLPIGQAVLWRTSGATSTVQIPLTTADDVRRVAGMLATGRPTPRSAGSQGEAIPQPPDMPGRSQAVAAAERLRSASVPAEAARAAQMFLDGLDPAAIVWELRQVRSSQGGKYQVALVEVLAMIRAGIRGT